MIDGCSAWDAHVLLAHGEVARIWTVEQSIATGKRKRRVEAEQITPISTVELHAGSPGLFQGPDVLPIDPLLLDEDRKRTKRR
jgi:hypothetical protein